MGYRSGIRVFKPIIKKLYKASYEADQWGLLLLYTIFFIGFAIIVLFCLLFTTKTVSTGFKHYAKKEPKKAKKVLDSITFAFDNIKEHFLKRLRK